MKNDEFKLSIGIFLLFLGSFIVQNYVIFPIESRIFEPEVVQIASLMFIPQGVKVIVAVLYGPLAVFPILVGQTLGIYMYTFDFQFSFSFGAIAVLGVFTPVFLIAYLERGGYEGDQDPLTKRNTLILGRKVIVIALISSLLNSYFASLLNGAMPEPKIWLRFLAGDMIGTLVVFGIIYILRGKIRTWLFEKSGVEQRKSM
ncbi:MAG: hypothetical protein HWE12_15415 [Oceanospirillaceae bacterium]|nr:hypothetical protein [Oceanospirillaceae bacterium]